MTGSFVLTAAHVWNLKSPCLRQQHEIETVATALLESFTGTEACVDVSLSRGNNDAVVLQVVMERQTEQSSRGWFEIVEELVLETVEDADEKVLTFDRLSACRRRV